MKKKEEIMEKLEIELWASDCKVFEPTCCNKCEKIFNWLWKSIISTQVTKKIK